MSEEYFDLVDENNDYTGETAPRKAVHARGLWHRSMHVYFFRRTGDRIELLVHLRSNGKDMNDGKWDTRFGGHPKAGESMEEAVLGEIRDEVGLHLKIGDLIEGDFQKDDHFPNRQFSKNFFYEFSGDEKDLKFNDGEVQAVKWMSEDEIRQSLEKEPGIWTTQSAVKFDRIIHLLKSKI